MQHDFASAGRQRLCSSCGSLDNRHQRHECPTLTNPKGSPKGKGKGKEKGKPKTAAMATSTANASAVTSVPEEQSPTVSRAAVLPVASSDSATGSNTTAQLEQEAIRILKRLSCVECDEWGSVQGASWCQDGGTPCAVNMVELFGLRVCRGRNHSEAEGKGVPSGPCIEEVSEKSLTSPGEEVSVDREDGVAPGDGPHVGGDIYHQTCPVVGK